MQSVDRRSHLAAPYWAAFLGSPDGRTVFEGLYRVSNEELLTEAAADPITNEAIPAGTCSRYHLDPIEEFEPYSGRLLIEWGGGASGKRAWVQRADNQDKMITGVLEAKFEQPFPGYLAFRHTIGGLAQMSPSWVHHLQSARGVYLLSCPATGRLYTGSATGVAGFWGRWQNYALTGHGGNEGLRDCETSAFAVTILQVAGSNATDEDILAAEQIWKAKLLTREFGYNRN